MEDLWFWVAVVAALVVVWYLARLCIYWLAASILGRTPVGLLAVGVLARVFEFFLRRKGQRRHG